jgi:hypothetical protein
VAGAPRKVVFAVIDGLGPALLDRAIAAGRAPTIEWLAGEGSRTDECVSSFPSLTPVCLAALITGQHPAGSGIPGMTWYHRQQRRIVEYGSSLAATLAEGTRQMVDDVLVNLNMLHLSPRATTVFEALEDAGLETAAVNTFVCRGRVRHPITRPAARGLARRIGLVDAVYGPRRYFLGDLFYSDVTGAPHNFGGSVDRHGGRVARWLVTRDGFDMLFFYQYETDAAQHRAGDAVAAVETADRGLAMMVDAAGGRAAFLDRYAVVIVADHSQSPVHEPADASAPFAGLQLFRSSRRSDPDRCDLAVAASNRVAMLYRLGRSRLTPRELAAMAESDPAADVVCFAEDGWMVARRGGGELRLRPEGRGFEDAGDRDLLPAGDYPAAAERIAGLLGSHRAGDVVVSARPGFEYRDAGGSHHAGGGSHGSLHACDSLVPLIAAGFGSVAALGSQPSITDIAPMIERHFGVAQNAGVGRRPRGGKADLLGCGAHG